MRLRVAKPISRNRETRADRVLSQFPQAQSLIQAISTHTGRYKYGISDREIDLHYRFSELDAAKNFFTTHFAQFDDGHNDEHKILKATSNCVNLLPEEGTNSNPSENFRKYADHFIMEISNAKDVGIPCVSVIHGPTGSGKTAYSKCLFTAGIGRFWNAKIVPSRIEFSKFFSAGEEINANDIVRAAHRCQVRDFLIWRFFSSRDVPTEDEIASFCPTSIPEEIRQKLLRFRAVSQNKSVADKSITLLEAHRLWKIHVSFFDAEIAANMLGEIRHKLQEIQFLVSLDGFDALKTKDFLVTENYHGPVSAVAELLRNILNQFSDYVSHPSSSQTHVMVYMRDTTYNRIELELHAGPSGPTKIPTRWLAPPSYKMLVETVSACVERDAKVAGEDAELERFVKSVRSSIVKVLKPIMPDFGASQPISCAFSWNARHMKRHIKRVMDWALDNYLLHHEETLQRQERAGLSQKWLWRNAVGATDITNMAEHHVLEAFYLDDTRQLRPQFRLSSSSVTKLLGQESLEEALDAVEEYAEMAGLFDCIFNYLTKRVSNDEGSQLPHVNILIRICQLASDGGGANVSSIWDHLRALGYDVNHDEVRFLIITLAQNEFLVFHGYGNALTIDDCQFYLSMFGRILLNKVLTSTTYFSQAMMVSELPDEGMPSELMERRFTNNWEWISGCVFNAVIAFNIFSQFEVIEEAAATRNGLDFSRYRLRDNLRRRLGHEGARIFNARGRKVQEEKLNMRMRLTEVEKRHPEMDVLEEIWS